VVVLLSNFVVASGATVIATASAKNHAFVKCIGVNVVLNFHDKAIIENLVAEIRKLCGGFPGELKDNLIGDTIAEDTTRKACAEVVQKLGGGKVVAFWPIPKMGECPEGVKLLPGMRSLCFGFGIISRGVPGLISIVQYSQRHFEAWSNQRYC
jgi:NADPH:quinone reductase-like Zn-dependent oxidoreductase